jgi:hypothetical protein
VKELGQETFNTFDFFNTYLEPFVRLIIVIVYDTKFESAAHELFFGPERFH